MTQPQYRAEVLICGGTGCDASGSHETYEALAAELEKRGLKDEVRLVRTGCRGFCAMGPVMTIYPQGIFYCQVTAQDVPELVEQTIMNGQVVEHLAFKDPATKQRMPMYADIPFYAKQQRVVLRNCGMIDPYNIEEYIARGGYEALRKVLNTMTPQQVIDEIKASKLRGRGGAGFTTGQKWEFTARASGSPKYVVCNADEGDPGAFMDRSILEGDPHSVLEGMLVCGYAVGASEGYIYCRAEYPLAIKTLKIAIPQAEEAGFLGDHVMGTDYSFRLHIKEGAGAFVCGEETALLASIEGRRGAPRPRPPFPANEGLWGKPTNINNVKSYANIAQIITRGADWFAGIGVPTSPGTAIFALTGKVNNTGLVEVPMGTPLRDVVFDIGGGILGGKKFKAAQTGGPSGGCLPESALESPLDYESLAQTGSIMGSGGLVVMDEGTCMVEIARFFLGFTQAESCGKCMPCRLGTKQMHDILEGITLGHGKMEDIALLEELALTVKQASLCGLGQTAPNPVLTTIRYFRDEYEAHIRDHRCPAGVCKALVTFAIDAEKCRGCGLCKRGCPVDAIAGERKAAHVIDESQCIKCGACREKCPFGAVYIR